MASIRVVHVLKSIRPQAGAAAICVRGLVGALRTAGIESSTVTREAEAAPPSAPRHVSSVAVDSNESLRLVADADVVHVHGWGSGVSRWAAQAARKAGKPLVLSPLGGLSDGPLRKADWSEKLKGWLRGDGVVRRAAALAAQNTREAQSLRAHGFGGNVELLPYGLTMDDYERFPQPLGDAQRTPLSASGDAPPTGRVMLMLGPVHPVEGLAPALRAFAEVGLDAEDWSVVLAGPQRGPWRNQIEAAVRRKGGEGRVRFAEAGDETAQRALLARASGLVHAALHYRCPASIMQAVASGVPVVASPWVVPDGLNGAIRVVEPSRGALREALRDLMNASDEDRLHRADQARTAGRAAFDWSVLIDRYVSLYRRLA